MLKVLYYSKNEFYHNNSISSLKLPTPVGICGKKLKHVGLTNKIAIYKKLGFCNCNRLNELPDIGLYMRSIWDYKVHNIPTIKSLIELRPDIIICDASTGYDECRYIPRPPLTISYSTCSNICVPDCDCSKYIFVNGIKTPIIKNNCACNLDERSAHLSRTITYHIIKYISATTYSKTYINEWCDELIKIQDHTIDEELRTQSASRYDVESIINQVMRLADEEDDDDIH